MTTNDIQKAYVGDTEVDKIYLGSEVIYPTATPEPVYSAMPLTFEVLSSGTISFTAGASATPVSIQYSLNNGPWTTITSSTAGTEINVSARDKVRLKGNNASYTTATGASYSNNFVNTTAILKAYGNIMSMVAGDNFQTATTFSANYVFLSFLSFSGLVSAENMILPATALTNSCYKNMFSDTRITIAPELPAESLAQSCYMNLFYNVDTLVVPPELPATTLPSYCYRGMFQNCKSLTTAPELPALTVISAQYYDMFQGCSNLNYIKCLATRIENNGTRDWVRNVAATGTFVKNVSMTGWTTGTSGIPSGWTVQDA